MQTEHEVVERNFYKKMNRKRSLLLSLVIVGIGYIFLFIQCLSVGITGAIQEWLWMLIVAILFIALTFVGYSIFEYERKKYKKNSNFT